MKAAIILFFTASLSAALVKAPDANTLWIENGADMPGGWSSGLDFESTANGFIMKATGDPKRVYTQQNIPVSASHPWFVFEIVNILNRDGYKGLYFNSGASGRISTGPVTVIPKGIFAFMPYKPEVSGDKPMRIDLHGAEVTFSYMKMVKTPEYYIEKSSPAIEAKQKVELGDSLTVRVIMAEESEDVTIAFYDSYMMPQLTVNGQTRFQLKPENGNAKIWATSISLASCAGDRLKPGETFKPGRLFISANILGGGVKLPLWTCNPCEFVLKK